MSFDELCERWAREREGYCDDYLSSWVVYTKDGIVAARQSEPMAAHVAFESYREEPFLVDQVLPSRPEVFIGGGFLISIDG